MLFEYRKSLASEGPGYVFTEYHLDELPDGWLFNEEHLFDSQRWHDAQHDMYADILVAAIKYGCVGVWNGGNRWYYVHPSTRNHLMQVTCWDAQGPVGHTSVASGDGLAREIGWNDLTVYRMVA